MAEDEIKVGDIFLAAVDKEEIVVKEIQDDIVYFTNGSRILMVVIFYLLKESMWVSVTERNKQRIRLWQSIKKT